MTFPRSSGLANNAAINPDGGISVDPNGLVYVGSIMLNQVSVLGGQNTPVSKSDADGAESAALYSLLIPANTLGANSFLELNLLWTVPSSVDAKRLRGRFGGVVLWNFDLTTHVSYNQRFVLYNRNSLSSQVAQGNNVSWAVPLGSSPAQAFSVDFGSDQVFTVTAQWPVAGAGSNNITLEAVQVTHNYRK